MSGDPRATSGVDLIPLHLSGFVRFPVAAAVARVVAEEDRLQKEREEAERRQQEALRKQEEAQRKQEEAQRRQELAEQKRREHERAAAEKREREEAERRRQEELQAKEAETAAATAASSSERDDDAGAGAPTEASAGPTPVGRKRTLSSTSDTATPAVGSPHGTPTSLAGGALTEEQAKAYKNWKKTAMFVLGEVLRHPLANPFSKPVPASEPDYHDTIKRPLDLGTIKARLAVGAITSTAELHHQLMIVFANACMYNNEDHEMFMQAEELWQASEVLLENLRSADLAAVSHEAVRLSILLNGGQTSGLTAFPLVLVAWYFAGVVPGGFRHGGGEHDGDAADGAQGRRRQGDAAKYSGGEHPGRLGHARRRCRQHR